MVHEERQKLLHHIGLNSCSTVHAAWNHADTQTAKAWLSGFVCDLASAIGTQQAKTLPSLHGHCQVPHSLLGRIAILQTKTLFKQRHDTVVRFPCQHVQYVVNNTAWVLDVDQLHWGFFHLPQAVTNN